MSFCSWKWAFHSFHIFDIFQDGCHFRCIDCYHNCRETIQMYVIHSIKYSYILSLKSDVIFRVKREWLERNNYKCSNSNAAMITKNKIHKYNTYSKYLLDNAYVFKYTDTKTNSKIMLLSSRQATMIPCTLISRNKAWKLVRWVCIMLAEL